jgi:hypothetical protein
MLTNKSGHRVRRYFEDFPAYALRLQRGSIHSMPSLVIADFFISYLSHRIPFAMSVIQSGSAGFFVIGINSQFFVAHPIRHGIPTLCAFIATNLCLREQRSHVFRAADEDRSRNICNERSACLVEHNALTDIKPSFENETNIVAVPPHESAFSNCVKIVERDVEIYRKQA